LLTNQELGSNIIGEVKRMTLSYAIVGFDGFDLRAYKNEDPQFPMYDPREKKQVKVALHKYLSHKMEEWGIEWVDSAFEVFADIMETLKKENLKEVKFDNARSKQEELAELEEKVNDLRTELKMPRLVEEKPEPEEAEAKGAATAPAIPPAIPPSDELARPFNPFQKIPAAAEPSVPVTTVPSPVPSNPAVRQNLVDGETTSSPEKPHIAGRTLDDVIEERPAKQEPAPIEIDPVRQSVNPRFKQQR
jgi:hypothetical protein